MIKRIAKVVLFIPVLFLDVISIIFSILNWVFTGKEIPDYSILYDFLDW